MSSPRNVLEYINEEDLRAFFKNTDIITRESVKDCSEKVVPRNYHFFFNVKNYYSCADVEPHVYNPSSWEPKARQLEVGDQPWLHNKAEASLGNTPKIYLKILLNHN